MKVWFIHKMEFLNLKEEGSNAAFRKRNAAGDIVFNSLNQPKIDSLCFLSFMDPWVYRYIQLCKYRWHENRRESGGMKGTELRGWKSGEKREGCGA